MYRVGLAIASDPTITLEANRNVGEPRGSCTPGPHFARFVQDFVREAGLPLLDGQTRWMDPVRRERSSAGVLRSCSAAKLPSVAVGSRRREISAQRPMQTAVFHSLL